MTHQNRPTVSKSKMTHQNRPTVSKTSCMFNKKNSIYLKYSVIFIVLSTIVFRSFIFEGRSLIWDEDGIGQYYPTFLYIGQYIRDCFIRFIAGDFRFPVYDLSIGMGENIVGSLNYYGFGDPFNLMAVFATKENGASLFSLLYLLRLFFSGLAALLFCKEMKLEQFPSLIGALIYTFCGFSLVGGLKYAEWTYAVILLPLILTGAERVIRGKSCLLFLLSVIFGAVSGFYFMYMVSLTLTCYCLVRIIVLRQFQKIWKLTAVYFLGICLAAPLFFPPLLQVMASKRDSNVFHVLLNFWNYIPDFTYLFRFLSGSVRPSVGYMTGISIFEWLIILASLFFPNTKRRLQLKLGFLILMLMVTFPFFYWMFNAFRESNAGINDRWFFIIHFFFMIMFVNALSDIVNFFKNKHNSLLTERRIYLSAAIVTAAFMIFNTTRIFEGNTNWKNCFVTLGDVTKYTDSPVNYSKETDRGLFRVSNAQLTDINGRPDNIAMLSDYYGVNYWLSIVNGNAQEYVDWSNNKDNKWRSYGFYPNIYTEALAGCKYYFTNEETIANEYMFVEKVKFNDEDWYKYENPYYRGFACIIGETPEYEPGNTSLEAYNTKLYKEKTLESIENAVYDNVSGVLELTTKGAAGKLILAFPYDQNWEVFVDGEKTEKQAFNSFLSVNISEGPHKIVAKYGTFYMTIFLIMQGCAILWCSGTVLVRHFRK